MIKSRVTDFLTYRWRYFIGYFSLILVFLGMLIFLIPKIPGGLSSEEMSSAIISDNLNLTSFTTDNYFYHLFQHFTMQIFGVTELGIKLPSIILSLLVVLGIIVLLKKWYKKNISILTLLIAITTGQFLFIAQFGAPDIMILFWSTALILTASSIINDNTKNRQFYAVLFCVIAGLSMYTPLSIYPIIAIGLTALLHPHLRFHLKNINKAKLAIGIILFLAIASPVIINAFNNSEYLKIILGIPSAFPDLLANLKTIFNEYIAFNNPSGRLYMTPVFKLGTSLIILIGAYHVIKTRATAKSYMITLMVLCLLPAVILNPDNTALVFLPLVILLAAGLRKLLSKWYNMFPFNPYARIVGLIPIVVLVTVLVISGINRYVYTYLYNPEIAVNFSNDIDLIPKDTKYLVVSSDEYAFYSLIAKHSSDITVSTTYDGDQVLATRNAKTSNGNYEIQKIITNSKKDNSDRFYLYKKTAN